VLLYLGIPPKLGPGARILDRFPILLTKEV